MYLANLDLNLIILIDIRFLIELDTRLEDGTNSIQ